MVKELNSPLKSPFHLAIGIFGELGYPLEELRLGGGTALAMFWGDHRRSTDLDFAISNSAFFDIMNSPRKIIQIREDLRKKRSDGLPISAISIRPAIIGFKAEGTPISLVPSKFSADLEKEIFSEATVDSTPVRLAKPEFILRSKILGRLIQGKKATDRDGYDLAVMLKHHPSLTKTVLNGMNPMEKANFAASVKENDGILGQGRGILQPKYPEIAENPWGAVGEGLKILAHLQRA